MKYSFRLFAEVPTRRLNSLIARGIMKYKPDLRSSRYTDIYAVVYIYGLK